MKVTYEDNFFKEEKDRSKSKSFSKSSPLSPYNSNSSGLNVSSSKSDPKSDVEMDKP